MKLTVLTDNHTYIDQYYLGEPALCFYIENEGDCILFDTGYSDVYLLNAKKMGIDLSKINRIAFSHCHNDHTAGLAYFEKGRKDIEVFAHPDTFVYREYKGEAVGSPLSQKEVAGNYTLRLSREPVEISKDLFWLGEIPVTVGFEERTPLGNILREDGLHGDLLYDDTALAYRKEEGIWVITGCSHSGICNIIEHARKVAGKDKVLGVIGGFHLLKEGPRMYKTVEWLKRNDIRDLCPCHCVSLQAKTLLAKEMPIREVGVGMQVNL